MLIFYRQGTGEKRLVPDELAQALKQEALKRQPAEPKADAAEKALADLMAKLREREIDLEEFLQEGCRKVTTSFPIRLFFHNPHGSCS